MSRKTGFLNSEQGQSIIEFLLALPVMLALVMLMLRFNTPIQASIVHQRYARAQTLFLAMNSPYYPEASKRANENGKGDYYTNKIIVGLTRVNITESQEAGVEPESPIFPITLNGKRTSEGKVQETEKRRSRVRVWTNVSMCTQNWFREAKPSPDNFLTSLPSGFKPENVVASWCISPLDSMQNPDSRFNEEDF